FQRLRFTSSTLVRGRTFPDLGPTAAPIIALGHQVAFTEHATLNHQPAQQLCAILFLTSEFLRRKFPHYLFLGPAVGNRSLATFCARVLVLLFSISTASISRPIHFP